MFEKQHGWLYFNLPCKNFPHQMICIYNLARSELHSYLHHFEALQCEIETCWCFVALKTICRPEIEVIVQLVSPTQMAQNDSRCYPRPEWGAFECFGIDFVQLVLTSLDADAYSNSSAPASIFSQDGLSPQYLVQNLPPLQVRSSACKTSQIA